MQLPSARSLSPVSVVVETMRGLIGLPEGEAVLALAISRVSDPARLTEALDTATAWHALRETETTEFTRPAFDDDVGSIRAPLVAGAGSFFARWGSAYRGASRRLGGLLRNPMPKSAGDRVSLVDRLLEVKRLRARWGDDEAFMSAALGEIWRGERTDFARAAGIARWMSKAQTSR